MKEPVLGVTGIVITPNGDPVKSSVNTTPATAACAAASVKAAAAFAIPEISMKQPSIPSVNRYP